MDGIRFGANAGRDVSLFMAERVDQIQRNYINSNLMSKHGNLLGMRTDNKSELELSEYRIGQTINQPPDYYHPEVRQDNWIQ